MCIIFLLYQVHPIYPLIIASNRDEHLDRPTESLKLRSTTIISGDYASDDATRATATAANNDDDDGNTTQHDFLKQQQRRRQRRRSSLSGKDLVCGGTWLALDISSIMDHLDNNNDDDNGQNNNNKDSKHVAANHDDSTTIPSTLFRWIAITNYREKEEQHGRPSRGGLLTDYIQATTTTEDYDHDSRRGSSSSSSSSKLQSAQSFINKLQQHKGQEYNGFNLLVGDDTGIYYYGNRNDNDNITTNTTTTMPPPPPPKPLPPGIYGLSNSLLDTPWPKVQRGKELLQQLLQQQLHNSNKNSNSNNINNNNNNIEEEEQQSDLSSSLHQLHEQLMTILTDTTQPSQNSLLPNTGIGIQSERHLSSIFVPQCIFMGKEYGTRTSTSVVWNAKGELSVLERTWLHPGHVDEWFHFGKEEGRNDVVDS